MNQVQKKIALTTLISLFLSLLVVFTRPSQDYSKMMYDWFWSIKTFPGKKADLLILGDSRVYRGVSPDAMLPFFEGKSIHNMGYSSGSMSKEMLEFCSTQLKQDNSPIIVLGVSPYSLTTDARKNTHLKQEMNRPIAEILERKYVNPYLTLFESIRPTQYKSDLGVIKYPQRFYSNGWAASTKIPANPNEALAIYAKELMATSINDSSINETLEFVKEQSGHGIDVYGFRPPTTEATEMLENDLTKFDFENFISKFEASGGKWITISNKTEYYSYDGSHLDFKSAEKLSVYLAKQIKSLK